MANKKVNKGKFSELEIQTRLERARQIQIKLRQTESLHEEYRHIIDELVPYRDELDPSQAKLEYGWMHWSLEFVDDED